MDQGLFDKSTETTRQSGDFIRINRAYAPNPSGRADYKIDVDDFLDEEQTNIEANTEDIATNTADIVILNKLLSVEKILATVISSNEFSQPADSKIVRIEARSTYGFNATIKAGTSLGGSQLFTQKDIGTGTNDIFVWKQDFYTRAARTVYLTKTGGVLDIVIYYVKNNFSSL